MNHSIPFIILLILGQITFGQVNQDWRKMDINLIDSVALLDRNNPIEVEKFFNKDANKNPKDTLGFGWTKFEKSIGAGYISIWAEFFYYQDTIQSYSLMARLPDEKKLIDEYISLYLKFLPLYNKGWFSYKYKEKNILRPLKEYPGNPNSVKYSKNILEYMAPTSGDTYGIVGGLPLTITQNRKLFNKVKNRYTTNQLIAMMYSINPVSRLTAIEYYYKYPKKYNSNKQVDMWIQKVFKEVPFIKTISGCFVDYGSSKLLVDKFAKAKFD